MRLEGFLSLLGCLALLLVLVIFFADILELVRPAVSRIHSPGS